MTDGRHVICFGNALHGDDGFGPYLYRRLSRQSWPSDVRLFDAGTAGLDALNWLENCREALLVDALASRGRPGTLHVFPWAGDDGPCSSLFGHAAGIPYLLRAARAIYGTLPAIVVVGAEVDRMAPFAPGLTPAVRQAAERALGIIRDRLTCSPP